EPARDGAEEAMTGVDDFVRGIVRALRLLSLVFRGLGLGSLGLRDGRSTRRRRIGLGRIGLGRIGLGRIGLGRNGLGRIALGRNGLGQKRRACQAEQD